jgi:1-deoxy-D-xylulose-5-phosphate synthase
MVSLLDGIVFPKDLRKLKANDLPVLANELRAFLLTSVAQTGGHLASNLGVVELAIALHYVYQTPFDCLVWDVGHQCYPHKILTGRRKEMPLIRKKGGISGFPKRSESEYDTFGTAHAGTSISAALGMAVAAKKEGLDRKTVAVIGDGAMTAGMAYEALNHAGSEKADLLVILNDNTMSISPNVGAMTHHLAKLMTSRPMVKLREEGKALLRHAPPVFEMARRLEEHVKGLLVPGTIFEELGFQYIGPIDGHDLNTLVPTLANLRAQKGPRLLHVATKKGKGFEPAEADPILYHGVGRFDVQQGLARPKANPLTYSEVFGQWLCAMAKADEKLVAITPAMCEGSGMVRFREQFPDRYFDVGIAEQHALTFAAGLAASGLKPVVAIYSTFLQRAYDQLIHDIALQNLPVMLAIDRAGLVGADGATHAGAFDLSFLRCIPNMTIMAPSHEKECWQMLSAAYYLGTPAAVRYPRGKGPGTLLPDVLDPLPIGKAEILRQGKHTAILAFGSMVTPALIAAETIDATVVNMRFIKPLDRALLLDVAKTHAALLTVEENAMMGGAGSAVGELLNEEGVVMPIRHLGLPDRFVDHADHQEQLESCSLYVQGILEAAKFFQQSTLRQAAK